MALPRLATLLMAMLVLTLWQAPAQARTRFGTTERFHYVAAVSLKGPNGEQLFLARRIVERHFLLPYAIEDGGYVLGISGDSRHYFRLPEGEKLKAMQRAGLLPDPLPAYELGFVDLLFGHALWILLAGFGLYGAFVYARTRRGAEGVAAQAAAIAGAPPPVETRYAHADIALPMKLLPSRLKMLGILAICSMFVAIGVFLREKEPVFGPLIAAFFGLGAVVILAQMSRNAAFLELTKDGFTFSALFRQQTYDWRDVAGFQVATMRGHRMVGWNFAPGYAAHAGARRLASRLTGIEGALPDTYGRKAEDLAELMNELKARAARSGPGL